MRIEVLGPLRAISNGDEVAVTQPKRRAVLALLALRSPAAIDVESIIDALWQGDAPAKARQTVRVYVSELRRVLGAEVINTNGSGYRLKAETDVEVFRSHLSRGRAAHNSGAAQQALGEFTAAIDLWRGEALEGFRYEEFAQAPIRRLEEEAALAHTGIIEARLALGQDRELVPDIEALVERFPYREQLWAALMVALYNSGRQADALAAYRRCTDRLKRDLGIDPGPALRDLELAILRQDVHLLSAQESTAGRVPAPLIELVGRTVELERAMAAPLGLGLRRVNRQMFVHIHPSHGFRKPVVAQPASKRKCWMQNALNLVYKVCTVDCKSCRPGTPAAP